MWESVVGGDVAGGCGRMRNAHRGICELMGRFGGGSDVVGVVVGGAVGI